MRLPLYCITISGKSFYFDFMQAISVSKCSDGVPTEHKGYETHNGFWNSQVLFQ